MVDSLEALAIEDRNSELINNLPVGPIHGRHEKLSRLIIRCTEIESSSIGCAGGVSQTGDSLGECRLEDRGSDFNKARNTALGH